MSVYSMSEVGRCQRSLAAGRLGYEPLRRTPRQQELLDYATMCESLAAEQMTRLGIVLEQAGVCERCQQERGISRSGIHVELDQVILHLVGHLDRRAVIAGVHYPVEIKSLGRASWRKFQKDGFASFHNYAGQEALYLAAEQKPGLYWVLNRDTGQTLRYVMNDDKGILNPPGDGWERITLGMDLDGIVTRLLEVEINVASHVLPDCPPDEDCYWCDFRYLCPEAKIADLDVLSAVEAARLYLDAHDREQRADEDKTRAVTTLIQLSKDMGVEKFRAGGLVSFSYRGEKTNEYLDKAVVKAENPDLYAKALRKTKKFQDYTIRALKGGNNG